MYAAFAIGQKWDAAALLVSDKAGEVAKKKTEEMDVKELAQKDGYEFRVLMLGKVSGIKKPMQRSRICFQMTSSGNA